MTHAEDDWVCVIDDERYFSLNNIHLRGYPFPLGTIGVLETVL